MASQNCTLNDLGNGEECFIITIRVEGTTKRRLIEMGLTPGTAVRVSKRAPLGDPIEIRLRNYRLTLRADDARRIDVARKEAIR